MKLWLKATELVFDAAIFALEATVELLERIRP